MEYVILVIVVSFIVQTALTMKKIDRSVDKHVEVKDCTRHEWSYNKDNKLQCLNCAVVAGTIKTKGGNYEE